MKRELFVDTNVLLGLTFYSDRWFREARPAYDNGHEIHASDLVVFEYCCSPEPFTDPPENPEDLDIDWTYNQGLVGRIRNRLSKPYREYRGEIRHSTREELTLEYAIQTFIDVFEIREQAEPQVRQEFKTEFADKAITRQYITEFVSNLIDRILQAAEVMKQKLELRVQTHNSVYHKSEEIRRKWEDFPENTPDEPDRSIVIDATRVIEEESVNTLLSGDSDILALQEIANEYFGFSILSMADEYSVGSEERVSG